jgi:hypothetical protein
MATLTTTKLSSIIPTEIFDRATNIFVASTPHLQQLGSEIIEVDYRGKGGTITIPKFSNPVPATSSIDESIGSTDTGSMTATSVDLDLALYGDRIETLTALGQMQSWNGNMLAEVITNVGSTAGLTQDYIIADAMTDKVHSGSSYDATADNCRWQVLSPDSDSKPNSYITTEILQQMISDLRSKASPFADGYYRGIMPAAAVPNFINTLDSNGESLIDFAVLANDPVMREEAKQGVIGVWQGVIWKIANIATTYNPYVIASGAADGGNAYKTLVYGREYARAGFAPVSELEKLNNGKMMTTALTKYIQLKIGPNADNSHGLNWDVTFLLYGGAVVTNKNAGLYVIHKADVSSF